LEQRGLHGRKHLEHPVWQPICSSNWTEAKHTLIVNGVPVRLVRTDPGLHFLVVVHPEFLEHVASGQGAALIKDPNHIVDGGYAIGRLKADQNTLFCVAILETDETLVRFVQSVVSAFITSMETHGSWTSFSEFLKATLDHDPQALDPNHQVALDYCWLVGKHETEGVIPCGLYSDMGVFVEPQTKFVPVYSSSLIADTVARGIYAKHEVRLMPQPIKCLGCFLSRFSGEAGRGTLRGARLDDQFVIRLFTCDESEDHVQSRHFFIQQVGQSEFALTGCFGDGTMPIWVARIWDDDGKYFEPDCGIVEW
jgi:hypothetical protein